MSSLPDVSSLRLLTDVAELGGIGAAARAAGISQQSASERLRAMESRVGVVLLRRSTTGSTLTSAGRLVVGWSGRLLEDAEELETALMTLSQDHTRRLRVFASMTTAEYLVPRWLVTLRRERGTTANLQATNSDAVLDAVRSGHADLGFVEGPCETTGLAHRVVGGDELVLVACADDRWSRRRKPLRPPELAARRLTSREQGSGTRRTIDTAFAAAAVELASPDVELTTNAAVLASVRAGSPPAFVSDLAARSDVDVGRLVIVPTAEMALGRDFTAVWVGSGPAPRGPVRDLVGIASRPS